MFHSMRTPGPTTRDGMLGLSPSPRMRQQALTEGKPGGAKLGDGRVIEGKRLFEELARKHATPKRALGDKSNHSPSKGSSSCSGGAAAGPSKASHQPTKPASPSKAGKGKARALSPSKASLLRTPAPADASYATLFSPTPAARGVARELKTPVAQLGRAGAARARMAELMDARAPVECVPEALESAPVLSAEEEWPEIEYMPSKAGRDVPHHLHQLAGMPTGAELGRLLSSFSAVGFAGTAHGEAEQEPEVPDLPDAQEGLALGAKSQVEYDDGWDSAVFVPSQESAEPKLAPMASTSSLRAKLAPASAAAAATTSKAVTRKKPSSSSVVSAAPTRKPLGPSSNSTSASAGAARKPALSSLSARNDPAGTRPALSNSRAKPTTSTLRKPLASTGSARTPARSLALKENSSSTSLASSKQAKAANAGQATKRSLTMPRHMLGLDDELDAFVARKLALVEEQGVEEGLGFAMEEEMLV